MFNVTAVDHYFTNKMAELDVNHNRSGKITIINIINTMIIMMIIMTMIISPILHFGQVYPLVGRNPPQKEP